VTTDPSTVDFHVSSRGNSHEAHFLASEETRTYLNCSSSAANGRTSQSVRKSQGAQQQNTRLRWPAQVTASCVNVTLRLSVIERPRIG
jgi:hypothetical protein